VLIIIKNNVVKVTLKTVLQHTPGAFRFESDMTPHQYFHYNRMLNIRVEEQAHPAFNGAPIRYQHYQEVDHFHPLEDVGRNTKARVTRDKKTGAVKDGGVILKTRIADLNVYDPKSHFDYRISINVEQPVPMPTTQPLYVREKNRYSYRQQLFQVDMTEVKSGKVHTTRSLSREFEIYKLYLLTTFPFRIRLANSRWKSVIRTF
jgi:hypothetical protein